LRRGNLQQKKKGGGERDLKTFKPDKTIINLAGIGRAIKKYGDSSATKKKRGLGERATLYNAVAPRAGGKA